MSKALPRTSRLLVVLALGVGGCGGGGKSSSYPDASTFGGGGMAGAVGTATGGHSGSATGGSGGNMIVFPGSGGATPNGGGTGTTGTPPAAGSTAVLSGTALLMGPGATCSSVPATTMPAPDRWCGVFVPSGNQMIGLVAFNLTKALAGTAITCATGDVNCVPLNANIDVNANDKDASYGFFGQTLIYYDATTVYAWRPGWTSGRAIMAHSTTQPVQCAGAPNDAPNAICLGTSNNNLYAGSLTAAAAGTLPLVEALTNGSTGIGFSPDGLSVIWSVKTSSSSPAETLKMQTVGDATTRKTIATNISQWAISADATRWYWLSAPVTDANMITAGALQTAPYPAGGSPAAVQSKVGQYLLFGAKSAVTLTTAAAAAATGADMNVITDVDAPTTTTALVEPSDVVGLVGATSGGNILYATTAQQPTSSSNSILVDLRLIKSDGTGKCVVDATASADPGASFNASATAVEWIDVKVDTSGAVTAVSGQYTTIADCAPHMFSPSLFGFYDVTSGLLFEQNFNSTAGTADIEYAAFAAGVPGAAAVVQTGADSTIVPLFPTPARVLYTLSGGAATDGVYLSPAIGTPTPDLGPSQRALVSTAALALPASAGSVTLALARSRLASKATSIPTLLAAPAPLSVPTFPTSATRASLPFARDIRTSSGPPPVSFLSRSTSAR